MMHTREYDASKPRAQTAPTPISIPTNNNNCMNNNNNNNNNNHPLQLSLGLLNSPYHDVKPRKNGANI